MNFRTLFFLSAFLSLNLFIAFPVISQISQGGTPLSFIMTERMSPVYETREFPRPDMELIHLEDQANVMSDFPYPERMGVSVPVNLNTANAGTWETLADGTRIWRLRIVVEGALALGVYYDHFIMPENALLFLYNDARTQVIGAFTSYNNHDSELFATEFIQGDAVNLEYIAPAGTSELPVISISEVAYAYRFIYFTDDGLLRGSSWPCMINVACEEGDDWEDQSRGIARMSIKIGWNYYWCSGSLINNTNNDRVPYFLSAEHCGTGASAADRNQWIFYFNYQSSTCTGNWGPSNNSTTGCTLKAADPLTSYDGADFLLVQLNNTPPTNYDVYYNGWNRTNTPGASGVCLHHPAGDIKKISTYLNPMISSTWWNGTPSHWRVTWSPTVSGLSIMQGGSSGSPVFDEDKLIMGDLSGGYSSNSCSNPSPAWFGKIWYAWDMNGSTPSTRLKDWLDPTNTGALKQQGLSSQILPPVVDFEADTTYITQGESVHFTDLTTGNPPTGWSWTFPGGTPNASMQQHPTVTYLGYGVFDVTLTVINPDGSGTLSKTGYITVEQILAPEADFQASLLEITQGEMIHFADLSINNPVAWSWSFGGGEPSTSGNQHPDSIVYNTPGAFDVSLTASNSGGSDTELKENYILVNPGLAPTADFYADVTEITAGDTVNFFDLSTGDPTQWLWSFAGATPPSSGMQNPTGIVYPDEGTYNVQLRARNAFGVNIMLKENYIVVGNVSIKDLNRREDLIVYPNPAKNTVYVRHGGMEAWGHGGHGGMVMVELIDIMGNTVLNTSVEPSGNQFMLDLGKQPAGLYILRIISGENTYQKKISVIR
ncbi:MAG: PKD domain-containing protein [Bacteroidales bacterium]|nr:PKD domain-containing protein [Bacteroidales bacterium]